VDLSKLSEPLRVDQIEFRIQSINRGGYATILAYKNARCDMQRLTDVCGHFWKREHSRDNKNCIISIYNKEINQWVGREDTGVESSAAQEKGLASDSFKRAGTNWGIGIELYEYPVISIPLSGGGNKPQGCEWYLNESKKDRYGSASPMAGYDLRLKDWLWYSEFGDDGKLSYLSAVSPTNKGYDNRFSWGNKRQKVKK